MIDGPPLQLLRAHVRRLSRSLVTGTERARRTHLLRLPHSDLGDTEVEDFDLALIPDDQILRRQVEMNDVSRVRMRQSGADLRCEMTDQRYAKSSSALTSR